MTPENKSAPAATTAPVATPADLIKAAMILNNLADKMREKGVVNVKPCGEELLAGRLLVLADETVAAARLLESPADEQLEAAMEALRIAQKSWDECDPEETESWLAQLNANIVEAKAAIRQLFALRATPRERTRDDRRLKEMLTMMLETDEALYTRILDTSKFAFAFTEICKLAAASSQGVPSTKGEVK